MSESARARERLEFEAAAEAIQKGSSGKESRATDQLLADTSATSGLQFTTGGSGSEVHFYTMTIDAWIIFYPNPIVSPDCEHEWTCTQR